jgi:alkyl sulfatase BDS1-like metallo-beta-lactamase superfamily hydrolase
VLRTTRAALPGLLMGSTDGVTLEGDATVLGRLMAVLDAPDPDFAIVTP